MKLYFRKYGSGPTLVILHGLYGSSDNWVSVARKLSSHFTVILPDLRNHGQSPHSDLHSYDAMADDLDELMNDLGTDRFVLGGHSMGGKAAIKFALKWPERLNGLVIIDISPFGSDDLQNPYYIEHREILEAILSLEPGSAALREEIEKVLSEHIRSERTRGFIMKNLKRGHEGTFEWKLNASALLSNLQKITDGVIDREGQIMPVSGFPVVFIKGENSDYLKSGDIRDILKIFPSAEIIKIADSGHWVHAEKPDEIVEVFVRIAKGD
ncbi:MAG: alpha/beta fold hydrolase [Bacteroidales bacterium]|jgi:pimeloyl-ACP methyl ester carboxylesterase